jgi:hypothetical protein
MISETTMGFPLKSTLGYFVSVELASGRHCNHLIQRSIALKVS